MKILVLLVTVVGILFVSREVRSQGASTEPPEFPVLKGEYFGQRKPGLKAEPFALLMLSSRHGHYIRDVTFSPGGDEAYWAVIDIEDEYKRWVVGSRIENGVWTSPRIAAFSDKRYYDDVPCLSPSGEMLFFLSRRPIEAGGEMSKENIWYMNRVGEIWSDPMPLPGAVNSAFELHQQVSLDLEDRLYFAGKGADGYGSLDIHCSSFVDGEYPSPVNLGPTINGPEGEYAPSISPDGSYLIFTRNLDEGWSLFISFKTGDESWTSPTDLRETLTEFDNMNLSGSFVTYDGRYLIFFEERDEATTPYWVETSFIEGLRDKALQQ
jgi:hypothetical protein